MSDIQYSTESSEWPERACYGCRHHMGCTRKQQGFLGCRCRKHGNPIVLARYTHMERRACAGSTWHYGADDCPDWQPANPRPKQPPDLRAEVAAMHGASCYFCGKPVDIDDATGATVLHHVIPHKDGGTIHPENLRLAHGKCHDAHHREAETVGDYPDECGPIVAEMM
jgi:5-methylcytosine-specific restriction endonuclease McrA